MQKKVKKCKYAGTSKSKNMKYILICTIFKTMHLFRYAKISNNEYVSFNLI